MVDVKELTLTMYKDLLEPIQEVLSLLNNHFGEGNVDHTPLLSFEDFNKDYIESGYITNLEGIFNNILDFEDAAKRLELGEAFNVPIEVLLTKYKEKILEILRKFLNIDVVIHFPEITITNENDKSHTIRDLYVKVLVEYTGQLFNSSMDGRRTTFTMDEIKSGYNHSHLPSYSFNDWKSFCRGSGPINHTINHMISVFDIDYWRLFCIELDLYVRTESLAGVPYKKLERIKEYSRYKEHNISSLKEHGDVSIYTSNLLDLKDFEKYIIETTEIPFKFVGDSYVIGTSKKDWAFLLSNKFIEWYNIKYAKSKKIGPNAVSVLKSKGVLVQGYFEGNRLKVALENGSDNTGTLTGNSSLYFKGKQVQFVTLEEETENKIPLILHPKIIFKVTFNILTLLNYAATKTATQNTHSIKRSFQTFLFKNN